MKHRCELCGEWWSDDDGCMGCPFPHSEELLKKHELDRESRIDEAIQKDIEQRNIGLGLGNFIISKTHRSRGNHGI